MCNLTEGITLCDTAYIDCEFQFSLSLSCCTVRYPLFLNAILAPQSRVVVKKIKGSG